MSECLLLNKSKALNLATLYLQAFIEHVQGTDPQAAIAVERPVNHVGLLGFTVLCYSDDLIEIVFIVPVNAWFNCHGGAFCAVKGA